MIATIYHNPRCSKSRQALALLQSKNLDIEVVEYLKTPLSSEQLNGLIELLAIPAHDILRTKEADYKSLGLSKSSSHDDILNALTKAPKLLERPIVVTDKGARIGRPTEAIEDII